MSKIKPGLVALACLSLVLCASSQKKAEKVRAKDPQYQYNVGLFHLNNNNIDQALTYFRRALSLNPRYYMAWNAVGLAYSIKGNFQESASAFQKCLEISPLFTEARNNLGTVYQEMNFLDKAEEEFKKASQDANYESKELSFYNLARLYYTQDKLSEALNHVEKALQFQRRFAMAQNLKGLIYEKMNRFPEAVDAYEEASKIVPDDLNFSFNLAVAYFKNDDLARAKELFEKISPKVTDQETKEKIAQYLKVIKERIGSGPFLPIL